MELAITEHGKQIGSLRMVQDGLFWRFSCKIISDREQLRRIFVVHKWEVEYLGIPNDRGLLEGKIPRSHLPSGVDAALAVRHPRGPWLPWCGTLEGIPVAEAYFRNDADTIELALPPQEALKFPAWAEDMTTKELYGMQTAVLKLGAYRHLPRKEKDEGGHINEETEEMDRMVSDAMLLDDTFADDGFGGTGATEQGREADRTDL